MQSKNEKVKNINIKSPIGPRTVASTTGEQSSSHGPAAPELEALVREIIGRVADKWTMLILETLEQNGRLRFTRLGELVGNISQKMLTKTLRQMEADGLITRTIFPVIPPRVEYEMTDLGYSLGAAFCGVWHWAEEHREAIEQARRAFRARSIVEVSI